MDRLSQEIYDMIASFIERRDDQSNVPFNERKRLPSYLPPLASLSREWQHAIERRTFHNITLCSTELKDFQAICTGHRRTWITQLHYNVVLPTYDDKACAQFEREHEKQANNEAFTQAIEDIFHVLRSWEDVSTQGSIQFRLGEIFSPMDRNHRNPDILQEDIINKEIGKRRDLFQYRYAHSLIYLLRPDNLPSLCRISRFEVGPRADRKIDLRAVVDIAAKFSNLQEIYWDLDDNEKRYPALRRASRHGFAEALQAHTFPFLKTATMIFYHESPLSQKGRLANMISPPDQSYDPFSAALRNLSYGLTSLNLKGVIDLPLFWPLNGLEKISTSSPSWPSLQKIIVTFDITSPSGHWYFKASDSNADSLIPEASEPSTEYYTSAQTAEHENPSAPDTFFESLDDSITSDLPLNVFRTVPNQRTLPPLLEAFGKAAQHMPSLQEASLCAVVDSDNGGFEWAMSYFAPGRSTYLDEFADSDAQNRRLYFEVKDWRPEEPILAAWRNIGREKWGDKLVERFLEIEY